MAMAAYIIGMQKIASLTSPQKTELLSRDFLSSSRMTGNSEVALELGRLRRYQIFGIVSVMAIYQQLSGRTHHGQYNLNPVGSRLVACEADH